MGKFIAGVVIGWVACNVVASEKRYDLWLAAEKRSPVLGKIAEVLG